MFKVKADYWLFGIILVFAAVVVLMLPFYDQAFGDDFAYAQTVHSFLQTGRLVISDWSATSLVSLVYWGAAFSKLFGFSFKTLQLSVIPFLGVALIFFYLTLKQLKIDQFRSFVFTLVFLGNPWFINFTYTFQNNIPYVALAITANYFFLKSLDKKCVLLAIIGGLITGVGFLLRQHMIATILASTAIYILYRQWRLLFFSLLAFGLLAAPYIFWSSRAENITQSQLYFTKHQFIINLNNLRVPYAFISELFHRSMNYFYGVVGLLVFTPLIFKLHAKALVTFVIRNRVVILLIFSLLLLALFIDFKITGSEFVLGVPWGLFRYEGLGIPWAKLWKFMVLISFGELTLLLVYMKNTVSVFTPTRLFLLLCFVANFGLILNNYFIWDEYIMLLIPIFLIIVADLTRKLSLSARRGLIVSLMLVFLSLQIAKVRYQTSGVIWEKAMVLANQGIEPMLIDTGNFAWKPWFYYEQWQHNRVILAGSKEKLGLPIPSDGKYPNPVYIFQILDTAPKDILGVLAIYPVRSLFATKYVVLKKVAN